MAHRRPVLRAGVSALSADWLTFLAAGALGFGGAFGAAALAGAFAGARGVGAFGATALAAAVAVLAAGLVDAALWPLPPQPASRTAAVHTRHNAFGVGDFAP